ncbi:acyl-CoA dehydrogenase [Streptomyces agglomeratus]|uniref:acyl-CoA dehydrogenase family protein n=1 Tax=Streptomyces agglomeratus TaxID=285458 RepID=UPI0008526C90|nr:acyl-CoA dehydrogenase family protein [Streptomyces agglomeratus]OEJ22122.1 acyl-CoA dehydrogenase [Streptomyces agglomeratus]OEJ36960.1 acyl-CoA dehydrogenase [Streptomyces agglomeratus]
MSDSFLTEAQHALRAKVRGFAESQIAPRVARMERTGAVATDHDVAVGIARDLAMVIAREGWIGATIGGEYGGIAAGHLAKTIVIEEISRISAAVGATVQASQLGTSMILHFGSAQQKRTWLPRIATGACLPTIAVTELGSGSHVLGMQMTARREGRHYVLNGRKAFVGNSHIGHVHGVVARTGEGSTGLTGFLVEADRPGLTVPGHGQALGLRGFTFGELHFTNCRIPIANRLGNEGDGKDIAYSSSILYGRPNLTAVALGVHQAILDQTTAFTNDRIRYGRPLHQLLNIRLKVGEMKSRVMTSRLTAYHAAHQLDMIANTGIATDVEPCDAALMHAKLTNVELVLDSARAAMEIHAADGLMTATPLERYLRDAYHLGAPAGTSDIQRRRLAEFALGEAKEQWSRRLSPVLSPASPQRAIT